MFFGLVVSLFFSPAEAKKTQPKLNVVSGQITIHGRQITIPHVPGSVPQAHQEFRSIHAYLIQIREDIESDLAALYKEAPLLRVLPRHIKVRPEEGDAANFFLSVINDDASSRLESGVLHVWDQWQACLNGTGLKSAKIEDNEPKGSAGFEEGSILGNFGNINVEDSNFKEPSEEEKKEIAMLEKQFQRYDSAERVSTAMAVRMREKIAKLVTESPAETAFKANVVTVSNRLITVAVKRREVANRKAPDLAQAWFPFVENLNNFARRFSEYESCYPVFVSPDIKMIRHQAKLHFLERCRVAVWFCDSIWSSMTSSKEPSPLADLSSEK